MLYAAIDIHKHAFQAAVLERVRQLLEEAPSSHQPLNARAQTGSGSGIAPRPGPFNSTLQLGATRVVVPANYDITVPIWAARKRKELPTGAYVGRPDAKC
jgi:hypothetical protein